MFPINSDSNVINKCCSISYVIYNLLSLSLGTSFFLYLSSSLSFSIFSLLFSSHNCWFSSSSSPTVTATSPETTAITVSWEWTYPEENLTSNLDIGIICITICWFIRHALSRLGEVEWFLLLFTTMCKSFLLLLLLLRWYIFPSSLNPDLCKFFTFNFFPFYVFDEMSHWISIFSFVELNRCWQKFLYFFSLYRGERHWQKVMHLHF